MKSKAIDMLGETGLQLPAAVAAALDANDRVKFLFSLLQSALMQTAPGPGGDARFEQVAEQTAHLGNDVYAIPDFGRIRADIASALETMLAPFADGPARQPAFAQRFAALRDALMAIPVDATPKSAIDAITATDRGRGDSLHLLVMDVHHALNGLQAQLAEAMIDGAAVYALGPGDEELVRAFMAGVNRTAVLKFDHPGLGATATRVGERLLIQNDIGTTDAHVIVIHVDPAAIAITYSDVHLARLQFFRSLFPASVARWTDPLIREEKGLAKNEPFYLTTGVFPAQDAAVSRRDLDLIGSRLVFLIDWNKARKRLRPFLENDDSVDLLKWAADENIGHRGFLQMGGEKLIYDAVETASGGQIRYGETLADMLGADRALGFLKFTFRACAAGLLEGRSESLIRDQIRAELFSLFQSREQQLLDLAADHGGYILHIADAVREALAGWGFAADEQESAALTRRTKQWERAADEQLMALRARAHGKPEAALLCRIVEHADDAADTLEEAAYMISLFPGCAAGEKFIDPLQSLAALLVEDAREWIKLLANAARLHQHVDRQEGDDFLVAADALARIERETDRAERRVMAALMAGNHDVRVFYLITGIAQNLEQAGDSLMRAAMMLHDQMLAKIGRG